MTFTRLVARLLLAGLFLAAGSLHLIFPGVFVQIMPDWVPFHRLCVIVSGLCELLGGVGLLIPERRIQVASGWFLTLLLVAVFPANIHMAVDQTPVNGQHFSPFLLWARLPVQPILIAVVWWATEGWSGICTRKSVELKTSDRQPIK